MARVLVTSPVPEAALEPLAGHVVVTGSTDRMTPEELVESARDVEAIVCHLHDPIGAAVFGAATRLVVVATVSVGYDNIDVEAATRAKVAVCNTPGVLDDTTADLAFALILSASRLMSEAERDLRAGKVDRVAARRLARARRPRRHTRARRLRAHRDGGRPARGRLLDARAPPHPATNRSPGLRRRS